MNSFPLVIAHRGDSSKALENSLEAMRLAVDLSVDMIEFDIRKSRDNELFVMHDTNTGRTGDAVIDIEASTAAEISHLKLKNGEKIPTLKDVLALVAGHVGLNVEIKSEGAGALLVRQLEEMRYSGDVIVSSFIEKEVDAVRRLASYHSGLIFDRFTTREIGPYCDKGYDIVSLNRKIITSELVRELRGEGIRTLVWTVDDRREMEKLISWGVDGIFTNDPGLLLDVIAELRNRR